MPAGSTFSGLTALGWDHRWVSALVDVGDPVLWPARVSRVDRGVCTVMTGSAEVRVVTERDVEVAVGDWVGVAGSAADGTARIAAVLPRRAVFRRAPAAKGAGAKVVAANIDTVFICDALDGRLGLRHLERFLALGWQSGATPVVVITKSDAVPLQGVTEAVEAVKQWPEGPVWSWSVRGLVTVCAHWSLTSCRVTPSRYWACPGQESRHWPTCWRVMRSWRPGRYVATAADATRLLTVSWSCFPTAVF